MSKDCLSFLDFFENIKDHRVDRKKLYPIEELLLITVSGLICGAEGWKDLELFGNQKIDFLKTILSFNNGIPTDDTFRRFFRALEPEQFKTSFMNWIKALQQGASKLVSIDGKTLRRSHDRVNNQKPLHMVSAWCSEMGIVLGQLKTDEKSNEITAISELIELLSIEKSVITIDAIGCQRKIAKQIINKNADYVLAVKDNQKSLHKEIESFFTRHKKLNFEGKGYNFEQFEEIDKGHGRIEIRKCVSIDQISWMYEKDKWEGIKSIAMLESTRIIGDKTTSEIRFYISSLPSNATKIAYAIRSHWGIENSLHWVLDMTFNEDQSRIRKGNAPQNIAIIRHIALNMLKASQKLFKGISIKALRKVAGWSDEALDTILIHRF